jgi:hypothetical protein
MKLYLTMCGIQQKLSQKGEEVFERAAELTPEEAAERITERVCSLNPLANEKKIGKFIKG